LWNTYTAPKGKFIQKHLSKISFSFNPRNVRNKTDHLQDALSVSAPPSNGPTTDEIPNILEIAAMYIGLLVRGTENPTIVMPGRKHWLADKLPQGWIDVDFDQKSFQMGSQNERLRIEDI
jgi:hypothetical protein